MTERGQPVDVALACPFVAFDDERDERSDQPDARHRCYAESPPSPIARQHQDQFCLSPGFAGCPIFRAWAKREAARVQAAAASRAAPPPSPPPPSPMQSPEAPAWQAPPAAGIPQWPPPGTVDPAAAPAAEPGRPVPDLPPRQVQQGPWSQPPAWLQSSGAGVDETDDDRLDRLVMPRGPQPAAGAAPGLSTAGLPASAAGATPDAPSFLTRPAERPQGAGLSGSIADESAAAALASRLAAIGMADPWPTAASPGAGTPGAPGMTVAAASAASVPPVAPQAAALSGAQPQIVTASTIAPAAPGSVRRIASPEDDIIGARVVREPGAGGLSRILRWGRPQQVGDTRAPAAGGRGSGGRPPEPSWERPRRNEAYPTIRTRVGMPRIPRIAIGAIALALAAAFLFFVVPPIFVGDDQGGGGAGASPSAAAGSPSVRPSRTPASSAAPSPRVYVVRGGDTLSTIADRFNLTVDEILAANPSIKNPNQIAIGDRIVIPTSASPTPAADADSPEPSAS